MLDRNWNPNYGLCPFNCKKYRTACATLKIAHDAIEKLVKQRKELTPYQDVVNSACKLSNDGFQIIGFEEQNGSVFAVLMRRTLRSCESSIRDIYLFQLPYQSRVKWICHMSLQYCANGRVHIIDWVARIQNHGYGSILMKHLISFLTSANFNCITGVISPVDYDHEDLLLHFYSKFGFEIIDKARQRSIYLDLNKDPCPVDKTSR